MVGFFVGVRVGEACVVGTCVVGTTVLPKVGLADGRKLGRQVGYTEGNFVGFCSGGLVECAVGLSTVGKREENLVGEEDGLFDGDFVGALLVAKVGDAVVTLEGDMVE